jgi:uncharacterized protein (TIGR04255 family)
MSLAPVFYTLAQVQFNPISQMSDYVARLQERLRRSGFPDFRAEHQFGLAIRRLEDIQPEVQAQQHMRWSFTNAECTEGYLLLENALVFHTTVYDVFEDFLRKTIRGLELVHEIVELAYTERIGLRYLDAVEPTDDDSLQDYLNPSLMGLSTSLEGRLGHSFTETVTNIEDGTIVARAVIADGNLALPPDLFAIPLKLQSRFANINARHAVLDTDYFIANRSSFDPEKIGNQLSVAHDVITNAFKGSVTDHAREKWE